MIGFQQWKLKMIKGKFKYFLFFVINRATFLIPDWTPFLRLRGGLMKMCFRKSGKRLEIASTVMIVNSFNVSVGNDVYFAHDVWVQGIGGVDIGDEVMLGPQTVISSSNHNFENGSYRFAKSTRKKVKIGSGTWTGSGTKIMGGVEIGKGVLCASGSVIVKDIPDFAIVAGVPAKIIGYQQS